MKKKLKYKAVQAIGTIMGDHPRAYYHDDDTVNALLSHDTSGTCDWCKKESISLRPRKDVDEGFGSDTYFVCAKCAEEDEAKLQAELEEFYEKDASCKDGDFDFGDSQFEDDGIDLEEEVMIPERISRQAEQIEDVRW